MVYLDDSIMKKGENASAGSKMLENFAAPFTATVVSRLSESTERVKLGEFGLETPTGSLPSPLLCNDVFGHIRTQAAKQGLCYIRPTYGTVSRFGLIPTACSMDQIGVVCKEPQEGLRLLAEIAGHDERDGAMLAAERYSYITPNHPPVLSESTPPYAELYAPVFHILTYAEISHNLSRYDGVKFGYRAAGYKGLDEMYVKTRTEGFGLEAKLAAIMGCFVLSRDYYMKYYDKAMRIRRLIKESIRFDGYDILTLPVGSPLPQLTGLPSLTFGDAQWMAGAGNEGVLRAAWEGLR